MPVEFKKSIPSNPTFPGAPTEIDLDLSESFPAIDPTRITPSGATFAFNVNNDHLIIPTYAETGAVTVPGFYSWSINAAACEAYYQELHASSLAADVFTFYDIRMTPLMEAGDEYHICLFGKYATEQAVLRTVQIVPGIYKGTSFESALNTGNVTFYHTNSILFSYNFNYIDPTDEIVIAGGFTQNIHDNRAGTPYIPIFSAVTSQESKRVQAPYPLNGTVSGTAGTNQDFVGEDRIGWQNLYFAFDIQGLIDYYNVLPDNVEDQSDEVGPVSDQDGYQPGRPGAFDDSSDTIALPADPDIGVSNVGFVRVYNTGVNSLQRLGVELFPPLAYTPPSPIGSAASTTDAIIDGFNSLVTFFANVPSFFEQMTANTLINYIIDCHVIPVSPGSGTTENIVVGSKTMQSVGGRIYKDYVDYSCGSISVGEYYGAFPDFLTSGKLYLPFVGFVPCRAEWFIGDTLSVDYKFNVIDGSFACYVRAGGKYVNNGAGGTIVGVYSGNACIHLPITGTSYASMAAGLVGAGSGMVAGAASGNIASAATSAIAAANVHGDIAQSNSYNGSAAFLSCRYPFLLIERPVSNYARNYQHELGIPANIYGTLGDVSGFVKMENVHLEGIDLTESEKEELRGLLASGVIN